MGLAPQLHRLDPNNWSQNHRGLLLQLALKKVSDYQAAEDLVQETFIAAWKGRDRFRGECSEKSFLCGILKNKIIDFYRNNSRRPVLMGGRGVVPGNEDEDWVDDLAADEQSGGMDPSLSVMRSDFMIELTAALAKLPEKLRMAYQLGQIDDLPSSEVAARLEISENNLWVCIHRARKLLRAELADHWTAESLATLN